MTCAHCRGEIEYRYKSGVGMHWVHVVSRSIYCAHDELVRNGESRVARPLTPRSAGRVRS